MVVTLLLCQVLGAIPGRRAQGNLPPYPGRMSNRLDQTQYPNLASIEAKRFRLGLKGYNVKEVDQFLSALVVEIEALQSALDAAASEVARLRAQATA